MSTLSDAPAEASRIVEASGSNLAFAFKVLAKEKREDMLVLYAFCRVIDDLADDEDVPESARRDGLERWRSLIRGEAEPGPREGLEVEFTDLQKRYRLEPELLLEIVAGVEMDLQPRRFETVDQLRQYCHRVASAVGLASIEIFGYEDPACRRYAEVLGYAFQWTNILRDVGQDAKAGRLYLPLDECRRHNVDPEDVLEGQVGESFYRLMRAEGERAEGFYREAVAALPEGDRDAMRAAEVMRRIYHHILERMRDGGYRVFENRYRPSKMEMLKALWLK